MKAFVKRYWVLTFMTMTVLTIGMELFAGLEKGWDLPAWTDLLTDNLPGELVLALTGALIVWLPVHFWVRRKEARPPAKK